MDKKAEAAGWATVEMGKALNELVEMHRETREMLRDITRRLAALEAAGQPPQPPQLAVPPAP